MLRVTSSLNSDSKGWFWVFLFGLSAVTFGHLYFAVWFHDDWSFWLMEAAYGLSAWR
jgi:hypothetical protein